MNKFIYSPSEIGENATNSLIGTLIVSVVVVVTLLLSLYSVYNIFLNVKTLIASSINNTTIMTTAHDVD